VCATYPTLSLSLSLSLTHTPLPSHVAPSFSQLAEAPPPLESGTQILAVEQDRYIKIGKLLGAGNWGNVYSIDKYVCKLGLDLPTCSPLCPCLYSTD